MQQPVAGDIRTSWKPLVVSPNGAMALRIRSALAEQGIGEVRVVSEYPRAGAIAGMASQHGCNLCFLDISSHPEQALRLIPEAAAMISVVAVNPRKDADLILQCLRLGACEFLSDPDGDQVGQALERLARSPGGAEAPRTGSLYCALPGKPGTGASTIATYLAIELRRAGAARVLLVDTDPVASSVSFLLKLKPGFHVGDAVRDWSRMDDDLWSRLAMPCHGIDVLPAPDDPATRLEIDPEAASGLATFWRKQYDSIVVDVSGAQAPGCEFATLADEVLVVATNEMAALDSTRRSLDCLAKNSVDPARIRLVVNRYAPAAGLKRDGVMDALKIEPYALLCND
jgi:Flp pilus assembly CpaE family ATPase